MNGVEVGEGDIGRGGGGGGGGVAGCDGEAAAVGLEELRKRMADFARERDWEQFHSPRNLLLALVGEVGELSEIFQWKGEVPKGLPGWGEAEKVHLGEELADVLLYLIRLSDMCGVDLGRAALRKLEINERKYPASQCKGSSKKHTYYISNSNVSGNGNGNGTNHLNANEEHNSSSGGGGDDGTGVYVLESTLEG